MTGCVKSYDEWLADLRPGKITQHDLGMIIGLLQTDRASHDGQAPRLQPGKRREEQTVLDRIRDVYAEVGRCTDCSAHHKHNHACPSCGAAPSEHAAPLPEIRGTCTCPHPARRHDAEDGCLVGDCDCSGHPSEVAA